MNIAAFIFLLFGVFSLLYFGAIILYAGTGTAFLWFWMVAGIGGILFAVILRLQYANKIVINRYFRNVFMVLFFFAMILFFLVEGIIISNARKKPDSGADYVIVLGAQVRGTVLSRALKSRLDTAYNYLLANDNTKVIVSGGQGDGEDISEAEAMSLYLISKGIQKDRIIKEDQSTNTFENIKFSREYIAEEKDHIVIVTNGFHVFRAISIAKKQGFASAQGLGAPNDDMLIVHYYIREFFAVIKDMVIGNI